MNYREFTFRLDRFFRRHAAALMITVFCLTGWIMLAAHNSYWLDEMYSVIVHSLSCRNTGEVIKSMWGIIHPPLYQITLFQWMQLFGHTEAATRSLSAVCIALTGLWLYFFAGRVFGRNIALGSLVVFCLMYIPVYYALETRSYAMMMMWASASSWALLLYLHRAPQTLTWQTMVNNKGLWLLVVFNAAGLFTHFYYAFFICGQGVFIAVALLFRHRAWRSLPVLAQLSLIGVIPPALLIGLWGKSMAARYSRGGRHSVDEPGSELIDVIMKNVITPNIDPENWIFIGCMIFAAVYLLRQLFRLIVARRPSDLRGWMTLYTFCWLILPMVFAFIALSAMKQDAYRSRYFAFTAPALALSMVVGFYECLRLGDRLLKALFSFRLMRAVYALAIPLAITLAVITVAPLGFKAGFNKKTDWRGQAVLLADIMRGDPHHRYLIINTAFRKNVDLLGYYLQRAGVKSPKTMNLTESDEKRLARRGLFAFDHPQIKKEIDRHDYVVVALIHFRAASMPRSLAWFHKHYTLERKILDQRGCGVIIFKTNKVHKKESAPFRQRTPLTNPSNPPQEIPRDAK